MTQAARIVVPGGQGNRLAASAKVDGLFWPVLALATLAALQLLFIFTKSFNWDEYLHYSMVYQLQDGSLARPFQTLLARILSWVPLVSGDVFNQMLIARLATWSVFLVGLWSVYGLARHFVSRTDAAWTALVYLSAGYVFEHGFAIRTDPIAMAALMLALYVLASRPIGIFMALAVGALVGFSGILTVKAMFYLPCFAGIAWWRLASEHNKRQTLFWLVAILPVAAMTFVGIYLLHRAGLAPIAASHEGTAFVSNGLKWLTEGMLRQPRYTILAMLTAPVVIYALARSASVWRSGVLSREQTIALIGLCLPLVVILFYRNVFPYFFVFILAPVVVGLAPAIAAIRARHGIIVLAALLMAIPVGKFITEPRDVTDRQRALMDYVHSQIPEGSKSFDYSGMIPDYPRVVDHLLSGIGLANYNARGIPLVAQAVDRGELAFVIDNHRSVSLALSGRTEPKGLLPADAQALHGNFIRIWGNLWLPGKEVPAGAADVDINIPHRGFYTADAAVTVNGISYRRGDIIDLDKGRHVIGGSRPSRVVLWRGKDLPKVAPAVHEGRLFTRF